jgi:NAD(P)-dependent dehydrogenase (short-subunit alcohol dehydrogenase family)
MASIFKAGHTAVITGGASGIGLSLAKKCFNNGMKVLVADWYVHFSPAVGRHLSCSAIF